MNEERADREFDDLVEDARARKEAIDFGRQLGEDAVQRFGEIGTDAKQRIARAMVYAAWEFDGKPLDHGDRYRVEFGIGGDQPRLSAERAPLKEKK